MTDLPLDPTSTAIAAKNEERDQLRAENQRLSRALVAACTEIEVVTADRGRLSTLSTRGDAMFVDGYDQAVREIRDHFAKAKAVEVVAEIEKIWLDKKS